MLRSYHVQDYGWTPLSQNLSWKRRYDAFPGVTWITLGLRVQDHNIVQPGLGVKFGVVVLKNNFKYRKRQIFCIWLKTERGIVRTRVAMCHDLLRFSLSSRDLCAFDIISALEICETERKKKKYISDTLIRIQWEGDWQPPFLSVGWDEETGLVLGSLSFFLSLSLVLSLSLSCGREKAGVAPESRRNNGRESF